MISPRWPHKRQESESNSSQDSQALLLSSNKRHLNGHNLSMIGTSPTTVSTPPSATHTSHGLSDTAPPPPPPSSSSHPDKIAEEPNEEDTIEESEGLEEKKVHEQVLSETGETMSVRNKEDSSFSSSHVITFERGYKRQGLALKNTILCRGRLVGGPQKSKYFRTLLVIVIPVIIFCAEPGVRLYERGYEYVTPACLILALITITFLTITATMDPGVVPRTQEYEKVKESYAGQNISIHGAVISSTTPRLKKPSVQHITIGGNTIQLKYCTSCQVFRPPRSFHCTICDNCIERFDHHCPWIGNCIATRNYPYFIGFLLCLSTLCLWIGGWCIWLLDDAFSEHGRDPKKTWTHFKNMVNNSPYAFSIVCFDILAGWFPILLLSYHLYLISSNQTTNEQMRNLFAHASPYSRGCILNIIEICCRLPKQSNVHLHHKPPPVKSNEAIIRKRKVKYLSAEELKGLVGKNAIQPNISDKSWTNDTDEKDIPGQELPHHNSHPIALRRNEPNVESHKLVMNSSSLVTSPRSKKNDHDNTFQSKTIISSPSESLESTRFKRNAPSEKRTEVLSTPHLVSYTKEQSSHRAPGPATLTQTNSQQTQLNEPRAASKDKKTSVTGVTVSRGNINDLHQRSPNARTVNSNGIISPLALDDSNNKLTSPRSVQTYIPARDDWNVSPPVQNKGEDIRKPKKKLKRKQHKREKKLSPKSEYNAHSDYDQHDNATVFSADHNTPMNSNYHPDNDKPSHKHRTTSRKLSRKKKRAQDKRYYSPQMRGKPQPYFSDDTKYNNSNGTTPIYRDAVRSSQPHLAQANPIYYTHARPLQPNEINFVNPPPPSFVRHVYNKSNGRIMVSRRLPMGMPVPMPVPVHVPLHVVRPMPHNNINNINNNNNNNNLETNNNTGPMMVSLRPPNNSNDPLTLKYKSSPKKRNNNHRKNSIMPPEDKSSDEDSDNSDMKSAKSVDARAYVRKVKDAQKNKQEKRAKLKKIRTKNLQNLKAEQDDDIYSVRSFNVPEFHRPKSAQTKSTKPNEESPKKKVKDSQLTPRSNFLAVPNQ